jgi:glycosyltransferase involved in cell wall biosynthesis
VRICFVSDQSFPAVGGEGVATEQFCHKLAERGHEVTVITSAVHYPHSYPGLDIVRVRGIPVPGDQGVFGLSPPGVIYNLLAEKKIQIVHVTKPTLLGVAALKAAQSVGLPTAMGVNVHEGIILDNLADYVPGFKELVRRVMVWWFSCGFSQADVLIAPSPFASRVATRYSSRPVEVVSNGVDLQLFNPNGVNLHRRESFRNRYGIDSTAFVILYVGRLCPEKNVLFLPSLASALVQLNPNFRLVVVGAGPQEKNLRKEVVQAGLSNYVLFTGYLQGKDLLGAYAAGDLLVLPSRMELQGIVLLEAMAMGVPLALPDCPESAAPALTYGGRTGVVFPADHPDKAAKVIADLMGDPERLRAMGEEARRVIREHDLEESVGKLEGIYHRLASNGNGRAKDA